MRLCSLLRVLWVFPLPPGLACSRGAHGTILCSACFPSAPVEWTLGRQAPAGCEGKIPVEGSTYRVGMRTYSECPVCHTNQILTNSGLRKHKPPQS